MADPSALDVIHELWEYHWWANRRAVELVAALGEETAARDLGRQWSEPTPLGMLAHVYAADRVWLERWTGRSPAGLPGSDTKSLAALRPLWDTLEREQRAFIGALRPADLARVIDYRNTQGQPFRLPLAPLLQHVPTHAVHHRSELATMLTIVSGSPPYLGMAAWALARAGQAPWP
jgi:uncharacterized damage-inducible protein DinB